MSDWERFNGWCVSQGVKFLKLHPADACDTIYYYFVQNLSTEKELNKFNFDLWLPKDPDDVEPDHPFFGEEAERREFDKSMSTGRFGK